jgi:Mce-associated membrane protein
MSSETGPEETPDAETRATAGTPDDGTANRRGLLAVALAAVVVLLVVTVGWLAFGAVGRHRDDAARTEAMRAARQTVQDFVSISAATVDRDLERVSAGATGDFADQFDRGKAQVKSIVVSNKVRSTGTVLEAAAVSSDRDSAVVLVVADATVVNTNAPKGQLRHYRIQVDLAKVSGGWRVSTLKFVG